MLFSYPMLHQYIEMVSAMFQRWPHFRKQQVNPDDVLVLWKTCLRTHSNNARQRLGHIAEVAAKESVHGKRKESFEEERYQQLKRQHMSWGMLNFMAVYPNREDDRTMDKQEKALVKQMMDSTFSSQRKALINDLSNVQTIADDYPLICNEEEVN